MHVFVHQQEGSGLAHARGLLERMRQEHGARHTLLSAALHKLSTKLRLVVAATPSRAASLRVKFPALGRLLTCVALTQPSAQEQQRRATSCLLASAPGVANNPVPPPPASAVSLSEDPNSPYLRRLRKPAGTAAAAAAAGEGGNGAAAAGETASIEDLIDNGADAQREVAEVGDGTEGAQTSQVQEATASDPTAATAGAHRDGDAHTGATGTAASTLPPTSEGEALQSVAGAPLPDPQPSPEPVLRPEEGQREQVERLAGVLLAIHAHVQATYVRLGLMHREDELPNTKVG